MAAAGGVSACALFAGLGAYSDLPAVDAGTPGTAADVVEVPEATPEASEEPPEADPPEDVGEEASAEAMAAPIDAGIDAAAVCRAQCSGCCDSEGTCHGGRSDDTCGTGAAACVDCTKSSMVCGTGGSCMAAVVDSGPRTCDVTKCTNQCPILPLLEAPCCKLDQTCGCGAVLGVVLCN
jgi:hypothetical protein